MKQRILTSYYKLLGALARRYIQATKPYIIGINGSVGKTSCRTIITQTLQQLLPQAIVYTSPKNFNGELGMSLSIFAIETYTPSVIGMLQVLGQAMRATCFSQISSQSTTISPKILVLEYGIDHPGEMAFLISIAKPHISVHTQIDAVHSLQFGSPEKIAREEFLLQENTREIAFVNIDDTYLTSIAPHITCDRLTYSATHEKTTTTISRSMNTTENIAPWDTYGQSATVTCNGKKEATIQIPLLWSYHIAYASVGLCIADILSHKFFGHAAYQQGDHCRIDASLQAGRWSIFAGIEQSIIIDSSYNASPWSVKHILMETTERLHAHHPDYQPVFILGEMRELGTQEDKEHIGLAEFLLPYIQSGVPLFLVGEAMHRIVKPRLESAAEGLTLGRVSAYRNYEELGEALRTYVIEHKKQWPLCLIFKGSQNTIFLEEAIKYVLVDPTDEKKLTRQWARRAATKQAFLRKSLQPIA